MTAPAQSAADLPDAATQIAIASDLLEWHKEILLVAGLVVLLVAWAPLLLRRMPLSLPILCVGLGMLLFSVEPLYGYRPHPVETPHLVEAVTELLVIVSLMGAGLKLDLSHPVGWRACFRLLGIAMPLTIALIAFAGASLLGLGLAGALLLGACLAPTDPVLASDVQVEEPDEESPSPTRFTLTSEAGLNDALAFPFVHLAIALAASGLNSATVGSWLLEDVLMRLGVGAVAGIALGWAAGKIVYALPGETRLSRTGDGFIALGVTLATYAIAEMAHGYGFLAVFLAGLMLRRAAVGHRFNHDLHAFAEQTERLVLMVLMVVFGGMLVAGGLIDSVNWRVAAFAIFVLLVARPVAAGLSLIGTKLERPERKVVAIYGIRGIGSVYYLAFAINHGMPAAAALWPALALVVLLSLLGHGITVTPAMARLEKTIEAKR